MRIVRFVLLSAGAVILGLLIAGHLNAFHPAFDSIGHFRLHLAVIGLLTGVLLLSLKSMLGGSALATVSALSLFLTAWPAVGAAKAEAAGEAAATYRLLQANLRFDNQTPEEFIRLIGETKPDVATIEEISGLWVKRLKSISAGYPYQLNCPGRGALGGVAIISRRPFAKDGISLCANEGAIAAQAYDFGGQAVTVSSIHLEWPWPNLQPEQLAAMAPAFLSIKSAGNPVLIGGDMNAAPWSAAVAAVAEGTGTKPLAQVWGTWLHMALPKNWAAWLGLPIDNILAGNGITLISAATQRAVGSDHRPILVEFSLLPSPALEAVPAG